MSDREIIIQAFFYCFAGIIIGVIATFVFFCFIQNKYKQKQAAKKAPTNLIHEIKHAESLFIKGRNITSSESEKSQNFTINEGDEVTIQIHDDETVSLWLYKPEHDNSSSEE